MDTDSEELVTFEKSSEDQLEMSDKRSLIAEIKRLNSELQARDEQISTLNLQMDTTVQSLMKKLNSKNEVIEQMKCTINNNIQCIKDLQNKLHIFSQINIKAVKIKIETANEEIILHSSNDILYLSQTKPQNTELENELKYENNLKQLETLVSDLKTELLNKENENQENINERMKIDEEMKVKDKIIGEKQTKLDKYNDQVTQLNTKLNELTSKLGTGKRKRKRFWGCLTACFRKNN